MKKLLLFLICFNIFSNLYCQQSSEIKNIFDPNNVKSDIETQNKITKNFDFTLYGIINTSKVKKVLIKPKIITREVKEKMGKSKYITLKIGEEFQNIKLIAIDNDTAKFKKGEKIISMRVFQNIKNDRIKIATNTEPTIINTEISPRKNKKNKKNNNTNKNFSIISPKKTSKTKKTNSIKKKENTHINPFLAILKKASQNKQKQNLKPTVNPFLELLKKGRR